jgi:phosphatidylglycerol lysyltransferase
VATTLQTSPDLLPNGPGADILFEWIGVIFWDYTARELLRSFRRPDTASMHAGKDRARSLLEHYGGGSYLPYRVLAGVAVTTGGPVGPEAERTEAIQQFAGHCARMLWIPCLYSVNTDVRLITDNLRWRSVQVAHGTELDLGELTFAGKQFQNVRTALNNARRNDLKVEWFHLWPQGRR